MSKPLRHTVFAGMRLPDSKHLAAADHQQRPNVCGKSRTLLDAKSEFPRRPDPDVLSDSIPLFFIGRNGHGFWVARDAEGRYGGLFLRKRSAASFASMRSEKAGYATMVLDEPVELDVENQGSPLVARFAAAFDIAERRTPQLATLVRMAVMEWRTFVAQISRQAHH